MSNKKRHTLHDKSKINVLRYLSHFNHYEGLTDSFLINNWESSWFILLPVHDDLNTKYLLLDFTDHPDHYERKSYISVIFPTWLQCWCPFYGYHWLLRFRQTSLEHWLVQINCMNMDFFKSKLSTNNIINVCFW